MIVPFLVVVIVVNRKNGRVTQSRKKRGKDRKISVCVRRSSALVRLPIRPHLTGESKLKNLNQRPIEFQTTSQ
jgi:hypothetical protein